jgi:SWI/SNF-related matrix-associated actin-dependent regulator 1 of chromatin subfamily A
MGLGKTLQILHSLPDDRGLLVVAPKSVVGVWPLQIDRWVPGRFDSVRIVAHHSEFAWPSSPRECVVLHYEALPYSKAMIAKERATLIGKRDGVAPKSTAKKKAEREGVVGLTVQLARAERALAALPETAPERGPLAELRDQLAASLKRNAQALERNAKLRPPSKPTCDVQLVIDEAHRTASGGTKRTTAVRALAKQARFTIGVTGTPVEDDPFLLQSLLTTCQCNPFDRDLLLWGFNASRLAHGGYEFERHPGVNGLPGPIVVRPGIPELLRRVMLRRRKSEVINLPPKIFAEVPVPIDAKLCAALDEVAAHPDVKALVLAGELPTFGLISQVRKLLATALIPTATELIEEYEAASEPVVVFSEHVAPIEALRKRKGWGVINGQGVTLNGAKSTSDEVVAAFQRGELLGVAATIASLQEGVTLTRASRMLFVDLSYSRRSNEQAFDRCHRPGQERSVVITVLTPDHPITRHVTSVLTRKMQFAASVLDAPREQVVTPATVLPSSLISDASAEESERWAVARGRALGLALAGDPADAATIEAEAAAWARREAREAHALAVLRRLLPGARAGLPAALGQARAILRA